jgi:hypothetical protein
MGFGSRRNRSRRKVDDKSHTGTCNTEGPMKYLVVDTVNKATQTTRLYEYDVCKPEEVTSLLKKHNNDKEFVAAYKVVEHEASV